jgi:hypothetical protein
MGPLWRPWVAKKKKRAYEDFMAKYYRARLKATDSQRFVLEQVEATFDFNMSSAIGIGLLGIIYGYYRGIGLIHLLFVAIVLIFVFAAYWEYRNYDSVVGEFTDLLS